MLSPSGSDKSSSGQQLLGFRSEMARERNTVVASSKASTPTSPQQAASESRFSAFTSISSDGHGFTSGGSSSRGADSFISAMPVKPGRSPNWSDAETRFLIALWAEQYQNISQQRNAKAWDVVARLLNQKLAQCGFETFRTGQQCKGRMKSIVFDYKTTKKRIIESGDDDRTCDYFDEVDEVLGKTFGNGSIDVTEASPAVNQESERALVTSGENEDSNASDEMVVVNIPTSATLNVDITTGLTGVGSEISQTLPDQREQPERREPPRKKNKRKAPADDEEMSSLRFLRSYMEESDRRDREFLLQMTQMDREREDKNFERTMKMMMEVAKVFKNSAASTHENPRGSSGSAAPPSQSGDARFGSGGSINDNSIGSTRTGDAHGTASNRDNRQRGKDGGAQDKKSQPLQFLKDYMEESDRKDREFLLQMTRMDREREEKSSEQTMRLMVEVAKVFRGGS